MLEENPFRYYLPDNANKLVIGSFPCFNGIDYGNWYYSGSGKNHFWKLLSDIYCMPADSKEEKKQLCQKNKIALTDIAFKVERKKNNCSDANLNIVEFNKSGIEKCLKRNIEKVFFTSSFVKKHFEKLFQDCNAKKILLLSPSPAANMHIGGLEEYKKLFSEKKILSPYEFRLRQYKKEFLS